MRIEKRNIERLALGCKVGKANQALLSQLSVALAKAGLDITTTEYLVLRAIYTRDGIQQCEIGDMTGKDKAAVSRCVAGLVKKELVTTVCESHKCLRVFLSDKGREIESKVFEVARARHLALAELTSPEKLAVFDEILEKIIISNNNTTQSY
ncbi:MAG: MarR family transcriptional regulator [Muribaculaceae bacterium]|nr:MarR family transcriptional regulator [Muribaculaceae bacterium]